MKKLFFIIGTFAATTLFAQTKAPENWYLLNPKTDNVYGVGSEEAYKALKARKSKPVIVAVIDSGTDIDHEDLKDVIWTNTGEIPGNGIDDDHNGYVDDVNGWSFLGGKNGDIESESTEQARIYHKFLKKFSHMDTLHLAASDTMQFSEFKKIRTDFIKSQIDLKNQLEVMSIMMDFITKVKNQNGGVFNKEGLKKYEPQNKSEARIKLVMPIFLFQLSPAEMESQLKQGTESMSKTFKANSLDVDSIRRAVVGDNPDEVSERFYGCNRVKGPDALHGTHVSGIIAAMRNNNLGIIGIADNVKIMPVRAVPDGDERDKDIANAIRYAVDNGAKIINMSFGKYYSPDKGLVNEAVKYAMSKDVLMIHAAGNEMKDCDKELSFPNREFANGGIASNWIQVGASSYKKSKKIIGDFSNYGKNKVDLFAPGVDIYSTVCDNKYLIESGTSMAAPAVTGVAAIIRSYFPELTASEVRDLLMKTAEPYSQKVKVPGTKKKRKMKNMCISGGFVNVNNAVLELIKQGK